MIVNMGFISEIFGYVLNFLYGIFNNYGIAIIVFSVLLRIILIPITIKQQKALKKNAKLQKEMKEIQEKYAYLAYHDYLTGIYNRRNTNRDY